MIQRYNTTDAIRTAIDRSRIVALLGPRQCGKTTLARQFVSPDSPNYYDLEDPVSLARLDEAMIALRNSASARRRRRCSASGPCSPTTTAKSGTPLNQPGRSA